MMRSTVLALLLLAVTTTTSLVQAQTYSAAVMYLASSTDCTSSDEDKIEEISIDALEAAGLRLPGNSNSWRIIKGNANGNGNRRNLGAAKLFQEAPEVEIEMDLSDMEFVSEHDMMDNTQQEAESFRQLMEEDRVNQGHRRLCVDNECDILCDAGSAYHCSCCACCSGRRRQLSSTSTSTMLYRQLQKLNDKTLDELETDTITEALALLQAEKDAGTLPACLSESFDVKCNIAENQSSNNGNNGQGNPNNGQGNQPDRTGDITLDLDGEGDASGGASMQVTSVVALVGAYLVAHLFLV